MKRSEYSGWLFDVYADPGKGAVIWFIGEDGGRYCFTHYLPITFYVGGGQLELDQFQNHLKRLHLKFHITERNHLFHGNIRVLAIEVSNGAVQRALFRRLHSAFPSLDYYNADLPISAHYFAATQTFPLAYSRVTVDEERRIIEIAAQEDKWDLKPRFPELRVMKVEPTSSPAKSLPSAIRVMFENKTESISTKLPLELLKQFGQLIRLHDPDIIRTHYGDMWLFPHLFSISKSTGFPFNPNRDQSRLPIRVEPNQFESYGHLVHRDQQTLLLGRLHLDPKNSMAFKDWDLLGTYETARLSNLPIQNAARRSAGGAFVGMQVNASLEKKILIPIRKQQRERFKRGTQLIAADNGGVIFKPLVGLHANVAEIDFFSMYPHIMTTWNISAETVGVVGESTRWAPGIDAPISQDETGIVASILKPILEKRATAKKLLEDGNLFGYNPAYVQTAYEFLKGLGWVSYGYQGFSGNRIGSIEAHEAINAVSRDVILHAKEAAEEMGFEVLHLYVDSLFIRVGNNESKLEELKQEIRIRTGLKVDLEGILRWMAFLPSKQNQRVPVPNCYFGVFRDGQLKCRGIMLRRGDTPRYIASVQEEAINIMARGDDFSKLPRLIPELVDTFKSHYQKILRGQVQLEQLVVSQTLSRNLEDIRALSPAARAALQLAAQGKTTSAGQNVDFVRIRNAPFVLPWNLMCQSQTVEIDAQWYGEQLLRAADEILYCFGVPKDLLSTWLKGNGAYWSPQDYADGILDQLPLLGGIAKNRKLSKTDAHTVMGNML